MLNRNTTILERQEDKAMLENLENGTHIKIKSGKIIDVAENFRYRGEWMQRGHTLITYASIEGDALVETKAYVFVRGEREGQRPMRTQFRAHM